ncbi:hypothetical protein Ahy_B02g059705 isoform C [Arachis hypogaea]|uniref:Uncharacterized protein n=1 Tax=Arachis hypogaea TaxID=3818 RepID=A0A445AH10_ARAHY|nr:hypothetical protein Ahy_B02g059705 isoform C [Arachis hypogaea]
MNLGKVLLQSSGLEEAETVEGCVVEELLVDEFKSEEACKILHGTELCNVSDVGWCVAELCRWLKNFQEKPIWKLHHEFSARFRSVPRRNAWSGLIPSEYTFMVEYDSSLNYDCRYRQWQQRIVGVDYGS